jgi:hypothetical protein
MRVAFGPASRGITDRARVYLGLPGTGGSPPGEPASDAVLADVIATVGALLGAETLCWERISRSSPPAALRADPLFPVRTRLIYERPASFVCGRRDRIAGYRNVYDNLIRFPKADYVLAAEAGHFLPVGLPAGQPGLSAAPGLMPGPLSRLVGLPAGQPGLFAAVVRCRLGRCA